MKCRKNMNGWKRSAIKNDGRGYDAGIGRKGGGWRKGKRSGRNMDMSRIEESTERKGGGRGDETGKRGRGGGWRGEKRDERI